MNKIVVKTLFLTADDRKTQFKVTKAKEKILSQVNDKYLGKSSFRNSWVQVLKQYFSLMFSLVLVSFWSSLYQNGNQDDQPRAPGWHSLRSATPMERDLFPKAAASTLGLKAIGALGLRFIKEPTPHCEQGAAGIFSLARAPLCDCPWSHMDWGWEKWPTQKGDCWVCA